MSNFIDSLDDETASIVFTRYVQKFINQDASTIRDLSEPVSHALQNFAEVDTLTSSPCNEGAVAKLGLMMLYSTEENRPILTQLVDDAQQEILGVGETIAIVTGALFLLQTHIKFEKDKDGKFSILVEKRPTSDKLLTTFIEKILGLALKGSERTDS